MTDLRIFDPSKVRSIIEGLEAKIAALEARLAEAKADIVAEIAKRDKCIDTINLQYDRAEKAEASLAELGLAKDAATQAQAVIISNLLKDLAASREREARKDAVVGVAKEYMKTVCGFERGQWKQEVRDLEDALAALSHSGPDRESGECMMCDAPKGQNCAPDCARPDPPSGPGGREEVS